jgi:peptide-methionine (R)-S-oxide reductase
MPSSGATARRFGAGGITAKAHPSAIIHKSWRGLTAGFPRAYALDIKDLAAMSEKVTKTDEEWRRLLTPEQYAVARERGTERAFTGKYWNFHDQGVYLCVCCGNQLFNSETKFDSGCGWPSFYAPLAADNVQNRDDNSFGMHRTEVTCSRCGAHLGHVFEDGPRPTGLRYCMNSASLNFVKKPD